MSDLEPSRSNEHPQHETQHPSSSSYSYYGSGRIFPLAYDTAAPPRQDARVLLFSQRNVERPVWHGVQ